MKKAAKTASEKTISADTSITSRKEGFAYLNELFIKRHRKILWRSTLRIAGVCAALVCGVQLLMMIQPGVKSDINQMVMTWLPYFYLYSLSPQPGYRLYQGTLYELRPQPAHLLLFQAAGFRAEALQDPPVEIMKINAVPALVIGGGLCLTLYASGGTKNPLDYGVLVVSILAMSVFFSIHYLTVYYLLQPYTAGTEMKSGTYRIVMILTYIACYAMMNLRLPILVFGGACIAFCVLYSLVACILVYKLAPQTFRLRT